MEQRLFLILLLVRQHGLPTNYQVGIFLGMARAVHGQYLNQSVAQALLNEKTRYCSIYSRAIWPNFHT
jgi:hypothetical protein